MSKALSNYHGSTATAEMVREQIKERWGEDEAEVFDPYTNCLPFRKWQELGYQVLKGEKSIRSRTFVEKKDENGNIIRKYPKTCHLFYKLQVVKADANNP